MIFLSAVNLCQGEKFRPTVPDKKHASDLAGSTARVLKKNLIICENEDFHWLEAREYKKGNV